MLPFAIVTAPIAPKAFGGVPLDATELTSMKNEKTLNTLPYEGVSGPTWNRTKSTYLIMSQFALTE